MLKFNCSITAGCEGRPCCPFLMFENSAEHHVPHIVIAGNYKESPWCKQGPAEKPFPPALCSCVHEGEAPISLKQQLDSECGRSSETSQGSKT